MNHNSKDAEIYGISTDTPGIVFQKTDVSKWDELESLIPLSVKTFGDVPDIYVANAGVFEQNVRILPAYFLFHR